MAFTNKGSVNEWLDEMKVSRNAKKSDTIITIPLPDGNGSINLGGGNFFVIAGPCTIESESQISETARAVKKSGASLFRGGAYKSRTSPYAFSGLREDGLRLLLDIRTELNIPVVTEIVNPATLPLFEKIDIIQVGERNMRNAELLRELGRSGKPILLKRSHSATLQELLMSAEYLLAEGCRDVILCERGIRTFEPLTRNTMDISSIPMLKSMTHLPVIADPSHATGISGLVKPLSLAATAAGSDGLIIEVHNNPACALCDGEQSLTPHEFDDLLLSLADIRKAVAEI